jgi:undecaprenyl-diphosphatase
VRSSSQHMAGLSQDPALVSRSPTGWRRWLEELGHREPARLAESGAILVAGFVAAFLLLYGFAWLAYEVLRQQTQTLDLSTLKFIQQFSSPELTVAAQGVSLMGSQFVVLAAIALLGLFMYQRRWGAVVSLVLVAGGAQILNDVLKDVFHRPRPIPVVGIIEAQQFSFPSGHAMVSAAFYLYLAYLTWHLMGHRWRGILVAALVLLVLLIGLARLYLEAHYLSDVVAGYVSGLLWADAVILGSRVLAVRRLHGARLKPSRRTAPPALP